jgi:hypothetical protein
LSKGYISGIADEKDKEEKRTQEKEERMSEFKEEKEEGMVLEQPESVFNKEPCDNKCQKSHHKGSERERGILDGLYGSAKKMFHSMSILAYS